MSYNPVGKRFEIDGVKRVFSVVMLTVFLFFSMSAFAWDTNSHFPEFTIDGTRFMLTFQMDDFSGPSVIVLTFDSGAWGSWGGTPDVTGYIAEHVTDEDILAKGSLHNFIVWASNEAVRRAKLHAIIPMPDPHDRIARLKYNLLQSVDWDPVTETLVVKPAPLP